MKKILVPTDFSEIANRALEVAVDLARKKDAQIELLNVKQYPIGGDQGGFFTLLNAPGLDFDLSWKEVLAEAKSEMDLLITKYSDVKINSVVDESGGSFINQILNHKADLIVMGSNGADGLKEFFGGSNAEELMRLATCPVLVVKGTKNPSELKKVVVAVDFTYVEFLLKANETLGIQDAELHFLHIDTDSKIINYKESRDKMAELALRLGFTNCQFVVYEANTVELGILDYTHQIDADLIVMYTHGRTGISHILKGSIAEDVANHSNVSVFSFVES